MLQIILTVRLIVEGHQLDSMQPEQQRVGVGRVDPGGCRVSSEQLAHSVLDQFLRVAPTQAFSCVLIDGGDVVTLWCADDGAE